MSPTIRTSRDPRARYGAAQSVISDQHTHQHSNSTPAQQLSGATHWTSPPYAPAFSIHDHWRATSTRRQRTQVSWDQAAAGGQTACMAPSLGLRAAPRHSLTPGKVSLSVFQPPCDFQESSYQAAVLGKGRDKLLPLRTDCFVAEEQIDMGTARPTWDVLQEQVQPGPATAAAEYAAALAAILDSFGGPITSTAWDRLASCCTATNCADACAAPQHASGSAHQPPSTAYTRGNPAINNQRPASSRSAQQIVLQVAIVSLLPSSDPAEHPVIPLCAASSSIDDANGTLPLLNKPLGCRLLSDLHAQPFDAAPLPLTPLSVAPVPLPAACHSCLAPTSPDSSALPVFDMPVTSRLPRGLHCWSLDHAQTASPVPLSVAAMPLSIVCGPCASSSSDGGLPELPTWSLHTASGSPTLAAVAHMPPPPATHATASPPAANSSTLPVFDMLVSCRVPPDWPVQSLDNYPLPSSPLPQPHMFCPPSGCQSSAAAPTRHADSPTLPVFDMPVSCRLPAGLPIWGLDNLPFLSSPAPAAQDSFTAGVVADTTWPMHLASLVPQPQHVRPMQQVHGQAHDLPPMHCQPAQLPYDLQWETDQQQLPLFGPLSTTLIVQDAQHAIQSAMLPADVDEPVNAPVFKKKKGDAVTCRASGLVMISTIC